MERKLHVRKTAFITFSGKALKAKPVFYKHFIDIVEHGCGFRIHYRWFEHSLPKKSPKEIYADSIQAIQEADIFIAEVSSSSISVGQQISYAIHRRKPVILCASEKSFKENNSNFLKGTRSPWVHFFAYADLKDLREKLNIRALIPPGGTLEKFNFLATPRIKEFLFQESKKRNISKSEFLRLIIEGWMEENSA